jgi:hypothetical protein
MGRKKFGGFLPTPHTLYPIAKNQSQGEIFHFESEIANVYGLAITPDITSIIVETTSNITGIRAALFISSWSSRA